MSAAQLSFDDVKARVAVLAREGRDRSAAPHAVVTAIKPAKLRPIEAVNHCDGCKAEGDHFAAARNDFSGSWEIFCRTCAEARNVPWGAMPCCACKRKTSVVVGAVTDGKATPVCRSCAWGKP